MYQDGTSELSHSACKCIASCLPQSHETCNVANAHHRQALSDTESLYGKSGIT